MRVALGLIAMFYGSEKVFGLFGGPGVSGTLSFMRDSFGISAPFAFLAMAGELLGGLGVLLGLLTPVAAFGVACVMAVATYENLIKAGRVHDLLTGSDPGAFPAVAFPFALFACAVAVMLMGAGKLSLDARFGGKSSKGARP
jgi:putative oxidoreductase